MYMYVDAMLMIYIENNPKYILWDAKYCNRKNPFLCAKYY